MLSHPSVFDAFQQSQAPCEGFLHCMYPDKLGLVTTGMGNLIDPIQYALALPWKNNGQPAGHDEIVREWNYVKSRSDLYAGGGGQFMRLTALRLDDTDIIDLIRQKFIEFETAMAKRFAGYVWWPADAQLAVLSICWATGSGFVAPHLCAALDDSPPDFAVAAVEGQFRTFNHDRQQLVAQLFTNAHVVQKCNADTATLVYPRALLLDAASV